MLPNILEIAEKYGIDFDPRTVGKKETLAYCPFCNVHGKYYLSLNEEKNIFKCWYCNKSGGVLQFEALLTGKTFEEVKEQYFGKKKGKSNTPLHPAYKLSPEQLKQIGWHKEKQINFKNFSRNKETIFQEWKRYEYEELVKYYALFLLISKYPFEEEKKEKYSWFLTECRKSKVERLSDTIVQAYKQGIRNSWTEKGAEIARTAYKTCLETQDFTNIFVNVLIAIEFLKVKKELKNKSKT